MIEVLISMVLLGIVLLGVQAAFTDRLIRQVGEQDRRTVALQLAADRVQAVQMDPVYGSLQTRYGGEEATIDGYPGFRRSTTFEDVSEDGVHYKTVTVTVEHDALAAPVSRTVTVAAP